ncbi:MAG: glucose-1-phosphate adenylyltransferase [Pseudomonadota bacterium]
MSRGKILAMILAGGEGKRLAPLTRDRAKPAVPFGGKYRIIDFVLSNFVNSGILRIKVLTQYKSYSLTNHLIRGWALSPFLDNYVEAVPAQMRRGKHWYRGNADAIYQSMNIITDERPEIIAVFGGDHIYKMDVRQMVNFHEKKLADMTVAAIPVPKELASSYGIIEVDNDWKMIGFEEKPKDPKTMPGNNDMCLASMGNYVFSSDPLIWEIEHDAQNEDSEHDFGKNIVTNMFAKGKVYVYDFFQNKIPNQPKSELGYWRDVGDLDMYYQANMDLISVNPIFDIYNDRWPIHCSIRKNPPTKFVFSDYANQRVGVMTDSLVAGACIISGGHVHRSILFPNVRVNSYSRVEDSIVFDNVKINRHAKIRRAIIDKNVVIPEGMEIGYDLENDKKRFHVSNDGIVVIAKGTKL